VAFAGTRVYYEGPYKNIERTPITPSYLTESSARSLDFNTVCVAARDTNWVQVGQVACSDNLASHVYNGTLRHAMSRSTIGGYVVARARDDYN
jgi:hypothetical protein